MMKSLMNPSITRGRREGGEQDDIQVDLLEDELMFLVSLETGGEGVLRGPVLAGFFCRLGGLGGL